jgi:hypothetical protein
MFSRLLLALCAFLIPVRLLADPARPLPLLDGAACRQAVAAAERAHGIPAHLLAAIARVESGRRDPVSGAVDPWPWTINADGQGSFYDNKAQAVAAALALQPRVTHSIDVGCMQISLTHHPHAFVSMDQAFDPAANADYGARYLLELYQRTGSWMQAVALYHSATPALGQAYMAKVQAAWPMEQRLASAQPLLEMPAVAPMPGMVNLATMLAPVRRFAPPRVILRTPGPGGVLTPGHGLAFYRAHPVRMAYGRP